ncbi:MAG: HD domain-containing protein [Eubacteriales bacterium]|nr:HD domain-containing protein [Eubacteriales bacterium]
MKGIVILNENIGLAECSHNNNVIRLLSSVNNTEVIQMDILPDSLLWMSPGDKDCTEFYFVLEGSIQLSLEDGDQILVKGDSFAVSRIKTEFPIKCLEKVRLLCVSNQPIFDDMYNHMGSLKELVEKTERKNQYTYDHGKRVMEYSLLIAEELKVDQAIHNVITMAAALHDVGKCFLADHILSEDRELTSDDLRQIKKHPINSYRLIASKFDDKIASMAQMHHEKLDGSGYPFGLKAREIPIEARIITVADVFDAMTTDRPYKKKKEYREAIDELVTMVNQYDKRVIYALKRLYQRGALERGDRE